MVMFADRVEAGRQLARELLPLRGHDLVVLGLPRGGVPVAFEVASALDAPLDVVVVRKLGVPFQPELAMGAIGERGVRVLDRALMARAGVTERELDAVERRERKQLESRVARIRRGRDRLELAGREVVIVDDGMATGSTARAACQVARQLGAARVVMAVPVAPADSVRDLPEADAVVCVSAPERFGGVGEFYRDFSPTTDEQVIVLLDAAQRRMHSAAAGAASVDCTDVDVEIPAGSIALEGHLHVPDDESGVVLFAPDAESTDPPLTSIHQPI
jgi:putative phosphoribosyl transferase